MSVFTFVGQHLAGQLVDLQLVQRSLFLKAFHLMNIRNHPN